MANMMNKMKGLKGVNVGGLKAMSSIGGSFNLMLCLRAVQGVFAVVVMGLSGYVADWYNVATLTNSPYQVNFLIAISTISFLSLIYLEIVPRFAPKFFYPIASLALQGMNAVFYFAGFVAISIFLTNLLFCRGSVCGAARADAVFASFSFLLWGATTALAVMTTMKARKAPDMRPIITKTKSVDEIEMEP